MLVEIAFAFLLCVSSNIAVKTECNTVWLTVASGTDEESDNPVDKLEINWNIACPLEEERPNTIRVFNADPTKDKLLTAVLTLNIQDFPSNYYRSRITARTSRLPGGWEVPGPHCFSHYVALYKNNDLVMTSCLQIQPTWMQDNMRKLGSLPIGGLITPGTHNSGSFRTNDEPPERYVDPYVVTQDCDVWTQLMYGIRYLDIRVAYYGSDGFWANHGIYTMNPLDGILRDVKDFLQSATGEVVILDFQRFVEGFVDRDVHYRLITKLREMFGPLIFEFSRKRNRLGPTLNSMVYTGQRLIICYGNNETASRHDWLWPPLTVTAVDQDTSAGLFVLLDYIMETNPMQQNKPNPLQAVKAVLTPGIFLTTFLSNERLRMMTDAVNRNLTTRFLHGRWKFTNIVATDFFRTNNLINIAIQANIERSGNSPIYISD